MVTDSESLAKAIEMANCETCKEVDDAVSEEVKRHNWNSPYKRFEQHMKEEDEESESFEWEIRRRGNGL